jgi:tetrahydromethanopterin S-methyltransferase subunit G
MASTNKSLASGASSLAFVMTSDNNLCLILRRLDEIERKLDRMLEELRTPTAIGYSVRRGNFPNKD